MRSEDNTRVAELWAAIGEGASRQGREKVALFAGDLDLPRAGSLGLGQAEGQDAILICGGRLVGLEAAGEDDRAGVFAGPDLPMYPSDVGRIGHVWPVCPDGQGLVLDGD